MDVRRKKLHYHAWHRGMRELDLLLGHFCDAHLESFSEAQLSELEALMDCPDQTILNWYSGREPVPSEQQTSVFEMFKSFDVSEKLM